MKKILLVCSLSVLFNQFVIGQITVTDADMPSVNEVLLYSVTLDPQGQDPTLAGANSVWDYSALTYTTQRSDTFVSVTSTPLAYQFYFNNGILYSSWKASYALKGVDIGIPQVPITDVFNFYKNSGSQYSNVGFGSNINGIPSSTRNIPVDVEYVFPLAYGNSNVSNSEYGMSVPTFGYYGQSLERKDTVDGWGVLTTPFGTFDCLRVKSTLTKVDTTYIDLIGMGTLIPRPEEIEYKWLSNGMSTPVLKIVTTSGVISNIEYQDNPSTVGVDELETAIDMSIFPNPTKDYLSINFNSKVITKAQVEIKDYTGRLIGTELFNVLNGNNVFLINMLNYKLVEGVYFLNIKIDEKVYSRKVMFNE